LPADELLTGAVADILRASGIEFGATDALTTDFLGVGRNCVARILFDRATHRGRRVHQAYAERDREGAPDSNFSHG
jgi:hypothetical protein